MTFVKQREREGETERQSKREGETEGERETNLYNLLHKSAIPFLQYKPSKTFQ